MPSEAPVKHLITKSSVVVAVVVVDDDAAAFAAESAFVVAESKAAHFGYRLVAGGEVHHVRQAQDLWWVVACLTRKRAQEVDQKRREQCDLAARGLEQVYWTLMVAPACFAAPGRDCMRIPGYVGTM